MREAANRQAHDRIAGIYDRRWQGYIEATVGRAVVSMELAGDERILDVAAGTGELIRRLRERHPGLSAVGADLSFEMLCQAVGKLSAREQWVQASSAELPFVDGTFDWVVCVNSFHCFREPERSLQQMRRVLRPGGRLLLLDWCDDYLICKLCGLWLRWRDDAFYQAYTSEACRHRLQAAGFTMNDEHRFRAGWLWGMVQFIATRS